MASVTFDTLKLVEKLKSAGIPPEHAEAVVRMIAEAQDELVTQQYLDGALTRELAPLKADIAVLKWMLGFLLGGMIALLIKIFYRLSKIFLPPLRHYFIQDAQKRQVSIM